MLRWRIRVHCRDVVDTSESLRYLTRVGASAPATLFARRTDPELADLFVQALKAPGDIEAVEGVESVAKELWSDVLRGIASDGALVRAAIGFFHRVGFLYKYKSYGVKVASPFGYSVFVLRDGEGFSFQLHTSRKLEVFHILEALPESFVYLSSEAEWQDLGSAAARAWVVNGTRKPECSYAFHPSAGDVVEVAKTKLVHTVVGCIVEEFATSSLDAVIRLFDQNANRSSHLPTAHPDVGSILRRTALLPKRKASRVGEGWSDVPFFSDMTMIDVDGELSAQRIALPGPTEVVEFAALNDRLVVVVPLNNAVTVRAVGATWSVAPGELVVIPQGVSFSAQGDEDDSLVALHAVASELALKDWRSAGA